MAKAKTPRNGKTTGTSNLNPAAQSIPPSVESVSELRETRRLAADTRKNLVPINLDDEIRRRAYELWEERGYEAGHQEEHWLIAEREVRQRYTQRHQHLA